MIRFITFALQVAIFILSILISFFSITNMASFSPEVHYASLPDAQIAYYTRGKGDPLLLIEGFGMSMDDWDPLLIEKLSKNHKLIIFDLREVGLSKGDLTDLTISKLADDSVGVLSHLKIQKADILGWSMGSLIAQEIALSYPERVDKLILASTLSADSHTTYLPEEEGRAIQADVMGSWETFVPHMFPENVEGEYALDSYLSRIHNAVRYKKSPKTPDEYEKVKTLQDAAVSKLSEEGERLNKLSSITVPTLIIAGEDDALIPVENNRTVAKSIPKSDLQIIPKSGHAFLFQNTDEVARRIDQFLR